MSAERSEQDDFLEDEEQVEYEEGQRSIFATGWFRAVLVLLVLAVIAVIAVPLIGGWFEPTPPPKLATSAPTPKPVTSTPPPAAPSAPTLAPATSPAPGQSAAAPSPAAPAPLIPSAPATPTPAPTAPPVASSPAPSIPAPARPEIPPASAPTKTAEKAEKAAKVPERTAALAPSKSNSSKAPAAGAGNYWVQVGAFKESRNAEGLAKTLRSEGFPVQVTQVTRDAPLHVVRVGGYSDRSRASTAREDLQGKGHTGFVTSGPPK